MHWPRLVERGRMKAPARLRLAEEGALKGVREDPLRDHGKPAAGRSLEAALRQRVGTCCARCGSSPPASACEARFRLTLGAPSTSNLRTTFSDINAGSARSAVGQSHQETVRPDSTHSSQRRSSQQATGLSWNLTFAEGAERVSDGKSGRSQVAITDRGKVPAEVACRMVQIEPRRAADCASRLRVWPWCRGAARRIGKDGSDPRPAAPAQGFIGYHHRARDGTEFIARRCHPAIRAGWR